MLTQEFLSKASVKRCLTSLIWAELKKMGRAIPRSSIQDNACLDESETGLGFDSYDRMVLASTVNCMFHLHQLGKEDFLLRFRRVEDWVGLIMESLAFDASLLTFQTSGSTGLPKECTHSRESLEQEVQTLSALYGHVNRVVLLAPCHHIYGFIHGILLPSRLNLEVWDAFDEAPSAIIAGLRTGDLVVSFPFYLDYFLAGPVQFPPGVKLVSSTAPMKNGLEEKLRQAGVETLYQIYGSSETGGVAYRKSGYKPYRLLSHWKRLPERDELQRQGGSDEKSIALMDHAEWLNDEQFYLRGRIDSAIQIGGTNVFPERVREVILQHPEVVNCVVRYDESLEVLKLLLVVQNTSDEFRESFNTWMKDRLSVPERPKHITITENLPVNELGKQRDW